MLAKLKSSEETTIYWKERSKFQTHVTLFYATNIFHRNGYFIDASYYYKVKKQKGAKHIIYTSENTKLYKNLYLITIFKIY